MLRDCSKRHGATYYKTRIEKARNRALCMGFKPADGWVLVLADVGSESKGTVSLRETSMEDSKAIDMMLNGTAWRMSVTNSERTVHLYIDP